MKNEDEDKIEVQVFDAEAIDRAMEKHLERVGSIEPVNEMGEGDENPTRTKQLENVSKRMSNAIDNYDDARAICFDNDLIEAEQLTGEIPSKNMGYSANAGLTRDDSLTATRLLDKNWSPLIVRKYQMEDWPLYVGIICDCNLNELDNVVYEATEEARELGFLDGNIQDVRNYVGYLSDQIKEYYNGIKQGSVEGVAILWYVDKMFCSSLAGDFMTHYSCKMELYQIVNTLPHI
jgi:hypothetical protein